MRHQILGYMPANVIPAVLSVVAVVVLTRLLSPREFGAYNLGFSGVMFAQGSIYYAIQLAVTRSYPAALAEHRERDLLRTIWTGMAAVSAIVLLVVGGALLVLPAGRAGAAIFWIALPLLLLRATVGVTQAQKRAESDVRGFVLIEILHAAAGIGTGLVLVRLFHPSGVSALLGLLAGAALAAIFGCRKTFRLAAQGRFDPDQMRKLASFALPLASSYVVTSVLQYSDRFLVSVLAGAGTLGIYAVAFSLVERPTTLLCTLISTATFPIAVRTMEQDGIEAARRQTGRNGAALLALALPACAGLALSAHYIAAVVVGAAFQNGVARLIPPLALAALVRNIGTHYLDHAFHIIRRSDLLLAIYGPAAAANVVLDLLLIPHFGMIGAVWASLTALAGAAAASVVLGIRHFGLWLPWREVTRAAAATIPMAAVLRLFHPPVTIAGFAQFVAAGGVTYAVASYATVRIARWR